MTLVSTITHRVVTSLSTFPVGVDGWMQIMAITTATTVAAGISAYTTGFIPDPIKTFHPPSTVWKPFSALIVPSLAEEVLWRAAWIPIPSSTVPRATTLSTAAFVLAIHVLSHPIAAYTFWPRGREIFEDPRFLLLATIVLGGATASYIVSGGSVWAAAVTHAVPVALWRDYFGGEERMTRLLRDNSNGSSDSFSEL